MPIKDPILRKEYDKKYHENHKEQNREKHHRWYLKNREEWKQKVNIYVARKRKEIAQTMFMEKNII